MTHVQDQYLKDRSQAKVIPALRKSKTTKILFCLYLIHFSLLLRSMNLFLKPIVIHGSKDTNRTEIYKTQF